MVFHLAREYPDPNQPRMTRAVKNFIDANEGVDHVVLALYRTADPRALFAPFVDITEPGRDNQLVLCKRYWGLPLGLFTALSMVIIAWNARDELRQRGIRPDILHAHKMAYEGIAGLILSRWLKLPLICSIRGEVEWKFFTFMPHYMPLFRWITRQAKLIYYVSAWFRPAMKDKLAIPDEKERLLPNFVDMDGIRTSAEFSRNRFVSILHLDIFEKKGLNRLVPAFARFCRDVPEARLDVIGRGEPQTISRIQALLRDHGMQDRITLLGWMPNEEMLAHLSGYAAMCLPSHNETFGMVYVEALLSGVPILYSRGTGIEGYVDDVEASVGVDPRSVDEIAAALGRLAREQDHYRAWLLEHHQMLRDRFSAGPHVRAYNADLARLLGGDTDPVQDPSRSDGLAKATGDLST